jgi:hypothetical protein
MNVVQEIYSIVAKGDINSIPIFIDLLQEFLNTTRREDKSSFYSLYPKILDRFFGEICSGYRDDGNDFNTNIKWTKNDGYLRLLINQTIEYTQLSNSIGSSNRLDRDRDRERGFSNFQKHQQYKQQLLTFFHPFHAIFRSIDKIKYELSLELLPEKIQKILISDPCHVFLVTDNNIRLLQLLLGMEKIDLAEVCSIVECGKLLSFLTLEIYRFSSHPRCHQVNQVYCLILSSIS